MIPVTLSRAGADTTAFAGAEKGDGVTIREIRRLDGAGDVIGSGGVALRN